MTFAPLRRFNSDNYSGVHAEVLTAIAEANSGHAGAYGADPWTERLQEVIHAQFGAGATAYPVFNGTGANVVALSAMLPRWGAVVAPRTAHINVDENGAPERVGGVKLWTVEAPEGKLTPELVDIQAYGWGDQHRAQPLVVSISQATELGTLYTPEEIHALTTHAHERGMRVHLDGSRLANAAAALGVPLRALTTDVGVDVVSLGGTKNGMLMGEAVVVLDAGAVDGVEYVRKLSTQLPSKMRFVSAQLIALYEGDLWWRSASRSNAMAARLRARLASALAEGQASGLVLTQPTETNAVFAIVPRDVVEPLRERFGFYDWDAARGEVRWMCSFDTTEADVDEFADAIIQALR